MIDFTPKFLTFDIYGTLIDFRLSDVARELLAPRTPPDKLAPLLSLFTHYRRDEVLGPWQPYRHVLRRALRRACVRIGVPYVETEADEIFARIPGFAPHPDVPEGLQRLARKFPLVGISNASNDQIDRSVQQLGAPFHMVVTAETAQSYKPQMKIFEHTYAALACRPEEVFHISASLRYDLMTADDLGVGGKAFVDRGLDIPNPRYRYHAVSTIGEIADLFGL